MPTLNGQPYQLWWVDTDIDRSKIAGPVCKFCSCIITNMTSNEEHGLDCFMRTLSGKQRAKLRNKYERQQKKQHYINACESKIRYSTEAEAKRRVNNSRTLKNIYRCHYCHGWHTTSRKPIRKI